jgi:hypothetical protein
VRIGVGGGAAGVCVGGRGAALILEKLLGVRSSSGAGGGWGIGKSRLMVPTVRGNQCVRPRSTFSV